MIKNTLPRLLEAVTTHQDCPELLQIDIWNAVNDNTNIPADAADYYALMLEYATSDTEEIEADESADGFETDNLALLLSGVLGCEKLPPELYEGFKEVLNEFTNKLSPDKNREFYKIEDSPEYLARLLKVSEVEKNNNLSADSALRKSRCGIRTLKNTKSRERKNLFKIFS